MLKRKPSPATVMSAVALFFSLGGIGYASGSFDQAHGGWTVHNATPVRRLHVAHVFRTFSVGAGQLGGDSVACPPHTVVTGGGFGASHNLVVHGSGPDSSSPQFATNTWNVGVENPSTTAGSVTVYVVCAAVR